MLTYIDKRYKITQFLGEGGMGKVYQVHDELEDKVKALKTIRPSIANTHLVHYLKNEFKLLTTLNHPNLCEVYDFGFWEHKKSVSSPKSKSTIGCWPKGIVNDGIYYFTMEFVDGQNILDYSSTITEFELYPLIAQIANALNYIHSRNFIHFDIKPANILVAPSGKIKLMDLGLAQEQSIISNLKIRGTMNYIAPEIIRGDSVDHRADLYSLGITLYQTVSTELPFPGKSSIEILRKHLTENAISLREKVPGITPEFSHMIMKLIKKNPSDRFGTANAIIRSMNMIFNQKFDIDSKLVTQSYIVGGKFVGRNKEMDQLKQKFGDMTEGKKPSLNFVTGKPGVGKTRLMREFRYFTQLNKVYFIQGACYEGDAKPFRALERILRSLITISDEVVIEKYLPELIKILPEIQEKYSVQLSQKLPPEQEHRRLVATISSFILDVTKERLIIINLDDIHWADSESLNILLYLLRSLNLKKEKGKNCGIMFTATYFNPQEDSDFETYLSEFKKLTNIWAEFSLSPLSKADTEELIKSMFGLGDFPAVLIDMIFDETGGNPFFIEEVMKAIMEKKIVKYVDEEWMLDEEKLPQLVIPTSVSKVLAERLSRLSKEEISFLRLFSVVDRPAHVDEIENFIGKAPEKFRSELLAQILQNLRAHDFLKMENNTYKISQKKLTEMLYNKLSDADKIDIHRVLLNALEEYCDDSEEYLEELAIHSFKGEVWDKAFDYLFRAGQKDEEIFSNKTAIDFYEKCLFIIYKEKIGDANQRKNIFRKLARLYEFSGQWDKRIDIQELWLNDAEKPLEIGEIYEIIAQSYEVKGEYQEALDAADKGLAAIKEKNKNSVAASLYSRMAKVLHTKGDIDQSLDYYDKSLHTFKEIKDFLGIAHTYRNIGTIYQERSDFVAARGFYDKSLKIFQEQGDIREEGIGYRFIGNALLYIREFNKALEYYQKSLNIVRNLGDIYAEALCYNNLGIIYRALGDFEQSLKYYNNSLEIHEQMGALQSKGRLYNNLGTVYQSLGQYEKAQEVYTKAVKIASEIGSKHSEASALNNLGTICRIQENYQQALKYYKQSLNIMDDLRDIMRIGERCYNIGDLYELIGERQLAKEYYKKGLEHCRMAGYIRAIGYSLTRLSNIYRQEGNLDKALQLSLESLDYIDSIDEVLFSVGSYSEVGINYLLKNNYALAKENLSKAQEVVADYADTRSKIGTFFINGELYRVLNNIPKSKENYQKALDGYIHFEEKYKEATCYIGLGSLALLEKNYELVIEYSQKALLTGEGELDNGEKIWILLDLMYSYLETERYSQAKNTIARMAESISEIKAGFKIRLRILKNIVGLNLNKKDVIPVEQILGLLPQVKDQEILWMALHDLAWYFRIKGDEASAKLYLQQSGLLVMQLAASLNTSEERKQYLEQRFRQKSFNAIQHVALQQNPPQTNVSIPIKASNYYKEFFNRLNQIKSISEKDNLSSDNKIELIKSEIENFLKLKFYVSEKGSKILRSKYFAEILEIIQVLNSSIVMEELLFKIVDLAIHFVEADSGCLLLYTPQGTLQSPIARDKNGNTLDIKDYPYSKTVVDKVLASQKPLYVENIADDKTLQGQKSIAEIGLRSVMCMPLGRNLFKYSGKEKRSDQSKAKPELSGLLYIDSFHLTEKNRFSKENLNLLQAIADQATIAIINASLYEKTNTDALTHLYLRPYFEEKLDEKFVNQKKNGASISLIMIDFRYLRDINRKFGKQAGDQILKEFAFVLKKNLRISDVCSRYGGDRFAIFLPSTDLEQVQIVADKLIKSLENHDFTYQKPTISLGISSYPQLAANGDDLLVQAEQALIEAKKEDKNQYIIWSKKHRNNIIERSAVPDILTGDPVLDYQNVEMLLEAIDVANSTLNLEQLLIRIVDIIVQITTSERCILMLQEESGQLVATVARNFEGKNISKDVDFSHSIPEKVFGTGEPVCLKEQEEKDFTKSMVDFQLRAVVCVPLEVRGKRFGVIYIDSHSTVREFAKSEMAFLSALARQIAGAIENARLHKKELEVEEEKIRILEQEKTELQKILTGKRKVIGNCEAMERVFSAVRKVATTEATVIIYGESGTGKESVAHTIHSLSLRKNGPFVIIDCGAIPENLMESELFGYEKGAFTGAYTQKKGKFELGNQGTIFLDEISELPMLMQVKLLRVLQESEIQRIGGKQPIKLDIRIVAATNKKLEKLVEEGRFRRDLYYRLHTIQIELPPLRERGLDILLLAKFFLNRFRQELNKNIQGFTKDAFYALQNYHWPGNIRELEHKIERAIIMADGDNLTVEDLQLGKSEANSISLKEAKEKLEIEFIKRALAKYGGNVTKASQNIGISRVRFHQLIDKYNIDRIDFTENQN